jgi:hypothetical protein
MVYADGRQYTEGGRRHMQDGRQYAEGGRQRISNAVMAPARCKPSGPRVQPPTPTARRRRGWPSAYRLLRRGQSYADGDLGGVSWMPSTPTAPTFGRRCLCTFL